MSKTALKKELSKMSKEHLIEQILDLYDKNSSVKEFYTFYLNPAYEKELAQKYKKLIRKDDFKVWAEPCIKWPRYCGDGFC